MSDRASSVKLSDTNGLEINPATEENQTNGTQRVKITNGTDDAGVIMADGEFGLVTVTPGHVSTDNSTNTPLGIGGVFTGVAEEVVNHGIIVVSVFSNVASATDGLSVQFSTDGINWDFTDVYTIAASTGKTFTFQTVAKWFRIVYTNGGTGQGVFRLQVVLKPQYVKPSSHRIADAISGQDDAELMKAVITGLNPNNQFVNIGASSQSNLNIALQEPLSAFGDLRTIEITPTFNGSFEYTVSNTDINENTVTGSGSVTQANAMAVLSTGTTTGSKAVLRTKKSGKYRPGLGGLIRFTGLFTTGVTGTIQWAGIFDALGSTSDFFNGYGIGFNGTNFSIVRFSNDTTNTVAQSSFDDKLDGSGASGIIIDPTKLNVFAVRFQYLGAGAISFYVEDNKTGGFVLFHTIKYANQNTEPSVYNPNFHFFLYANNKATTSNLTLKSASYGYFVEGQDEFLNSHQPQNSTSKREKTTVTTEVAICSIRVRATYAGKTNFIEIVLEVLSAAIEASAANNLGNIRLVTNATLGGVPSWSNINTDNSVVEIDTAGTTVTGGKTLLEFPLAGKNDKSITNLLAYKILLEENETVTIAGSSANSATINASLVWKELF